MDTCTPGLLGSWKEFRQTYIQPILEAGNSAEVKQGVGASLGRALAILCCGGQRRSVSTVYPRRQYG